MNNSYLKQFISVFVTVLLFAIVSVSCYKSDKYVGCRNNYKGTQCSFNVNGTQLLYNADSTGCIYDTTHRRIYLYSVDRIQGIEMQFNIYAPLQNFDLPLTFKDSFGTGTVTAIYKGITYGASYGNIGLNVNKNDNTVCGQFFYNQNSTLFASEGRFGVVRLFYK
jgi:hypothetical protein